jgi:DNA polymerase-3 subunit epsilon
MLVVMAMGLAARSFDAPGTSLFDATFVVLDVETTGTSAESCAITEVGALKLRGGECLGTFQTLLGDSASGAGSGPGSGSVPSLESVMPALLEFVGGAVVVGHNVAFDLRFLQAGARRLGYAALRNTSVDTCALARRLVRDEVPDCRLSTLARHFRTAAVPCHRAFEDARATAEVFHALLERAGRLGVLSLDDLVALPTTAAHPQASKLRWVAALPRSPGVYAFRDRDGRALYVGKAIDLRRRVRSYFAGDERRKVGPMLREAEALDHVVCANDLHATVLELRLIGALRPRFNRRGKRGDSGGGVREVYVALTVRERFPRLSVTARRPPPGVPFVGPLPSRRAASSVVEAIESAVPLRRCRARVPAMGGGGGVPLRDGPCTAAQLGVSVCPCAGDVPADAYGRVVDVAAVAMTSEPSVVLDALRARMGRLADGGRFEEAAGVRDRAAAFARAVRRQWRVDALLRVGRLVVEVDGDGGGGGGAVVQDGVLVEAWAAGGDVVRLEPPSADATTATDPFAEADAIAAWLDARAAKGQLRVVDAEHGWWWPAQRAPFEQ